MQSINARKMALTILEEMDDKASYSTISLNKKLNNIKANYTDRRFVSQLVYGVLENRMLLDHVIREYSSTKLRKINNYILNDLRLGAYQIMFLDRIPSSAAVNESVKLAKKKYPGLEGFVNGILRNISRNPQDFKLPEREKSPLIYLSVKYSHPEWLVERWISRYGVDSTEKLLKANNTTPELTIRANMRMNTVEELKGILAAENVITDDGLICKGCLRIKHATQSVMELKAFEDGRFIVQDEASAKAAEILSPLPGARVLDVCAAPGGKTLYMADLMDNKGLIVARDVYPHKLKMIADNAQRLGIDIIRLQNLDALKLDKESLEQFEYVLVDAPCSGLGIIRRKPEIRYNKTLQDVQELAGIQLQMLEIAAQYVRKGGHILYSTCTIEPEENEQVVEAFMACHSNEFEFVDIRDEFDASCVQDKPYVTLYPQTSGTDGFFMCKIRRR